MRNERNDSYANIPQHPVQNFPDSMALLKINFVFVTRKKVITAKIKYLFFTGENF